MIPSNVDKEIIDELDPLEQNAADEKGIYFSYLVF